MVRESTLENEGVKKIGRILQWLRPPCLGILYVLFSMAEKSAVRANDHLLLPALMTQEIRKRKARKPIRRFSELGRSQRPPIIHLLQHPQRLPIEDFATRLSLTSLAF